MAVLVVASSVAGVAQQESIDELRARAEAGDATAQYNLGENYLHGKTVPVDNVQAHMWLNLAASRATGEAREESVETRDAFALVMPPEQIAEAQRLAHEWDAPHPCEPYLPH